LLPNCYQMLSEARFFKAAAKASSTSAAASACIFVQDVGICVQRNPDFGMAKAFAGDLQMDPDARRWVA